MLYQDYVDLTTNLQNSHFRAKTDDILRVLQDYPPPNLPYGALLRIRRLGYVRGEDLVAMLRQQGFVSIAVDKVTAACLSRLSEERGGSVRHVRVHNMDISKNPKRLLQEFGKYTGVRWRSGTLLYAQKQPAQRSLPIEAEQNNAEVASSGEVQQWINLYRHWIGPDQQEAAKQHFLQQHPKYSFVHDKVMVGAMIDAMQHGNLDAAISLDAAWLWATTHLYILLQDTRPYKGEFHLFGSPDRLNRAFIKTTGKSFVQTRDAIKQHGQHTVVERSAPTKAIMTICLNGANKEKIATLSAVVKALGFSVGV